MIKIKAWDKRNNKWFEPSDFILHDGKFFEDYRAFEDYYSLDEHEYELVLSTGLKDKNGKDICGGDILGLPDESPLYVEFSEETGAFVIVDKFDTYGTEKYSAKDINYEAFEVIGNIYENPELLQ